MAWIVLVASGCMECVWAVALGKSEGFSHPIPTIIFIVACLLSMLGLSYALKTLPVGISETFLGEFGFDYAGMMTMSVVASLPVLLLFLIFQKYMVAGLTGGAVKE